VISDFFISYSLKAIDACVIEPRWTRTPKLKDFDPRIRHTIICGATIDTIENIYEGDGSILALRVIEPLFKSLINFYSIVGYKTNDQNLSKKLVNSNTGLLKLLQNWLRYFICRSMDILIQACKLGDTVYKQICTCYGLQSCLKFNLLL
jgi:hypothetical protein